MRKSRDSRQAPMVTWRHHSGRVSTNNASRRLYREARAASGISSTKILRHLRKPRNNAPFVVYYWVTMFRLSISCVLVLMVSTLVTINGPVNAQDNPQLPNHTTVHLHWAPRPGVSRFRLQLASDRNFRDIVFDRVMSGLETEINDLAP